MQSFVQVFSLKQSQMSGLGQSVPVLEKKKEGNGTREGEREGKTKRECGGGGRITQKDSQVLLLEISV